MKTITHIADLKKNIELARGKGKRIGLIPTMGALHEGHLSLIEAALGDNDFLIVTIFVNPTQFNDLKDLEKYPRNLNKDLDLLGRLPVDIVFAPDVKEMYPSQERRHFDLSPLDSVMEGKHRPGHFAGVAEIVSKLFEITVPHNAYFGLKDFQQLVIIRKLANLMKADINIIGCPIVRESDGLAMSSRNQLLKAGEKSEAHNIYKTLKEAKELWTSHTPEEIVTFVKERINNHPLMQLEYFEIVDENSLMPVLSRDTEINIVACIAVHLGGIRLIDNIYFA